MHVKCLLPFEIYFQIRTETLVKKRFKSWFQRIVWSIMKIICVWYFYMNGRINYFTGVHRWLQISAPISPGCSEKTKPQCIWGQDSTSISWACAYHPAEFIHIWLKHSVFSKRHNLLSTFQKKKFSWRGIMKKIFFRFEDNIVRLITWRPQHFW